MSFDSAYDPASLERDCYERWERAGYFKPSGQGPAYCIMIPPPNVTGSLHMGHGFNNTLMDALTRYHRMLGDNTLWQPGTDHAGIATQMVVERQLAARGESRQELGRSAFLKRVWEWKDASGGTITRQIRRLGSSVDWSRERFTMDEGLSSAVREAFVRLYREQLIYRGKRLVNWDPKLHTAISDLEVEARETQGSLWHFRYALEDGSDHLVVATTRPETLLGDTAVAVHPDDARYQHLIGRTLLLPLTGRRVPVVADAYVDPAFGSGCVKITPAHDFNDYELGQRHQLPLINIFDRDACILARFEKISYDAGHLGQEDAPAGWAGLERMQARQRVIECAREQGWLVGIDAPYALKVPHGDRSGAIIEPWLTDQWYVRTAPLASEAVAAVSDGRIRFVPRAYENMYFAWMRDLKDWCISRQLWWGHRIPAWYDAQGQVYVGRDEAEVRAHYHLSAQHTLNQDEDVLDTWFSSALWTFSTLGWPQATPELATFHPTDVLVTGFDIIFFWVARMIMMTLHLVKDAQGRPQIPFKVVYVHGLVRDAEGQKMSKSKGNVLDPLDIIDGIDLQTLIEKRTQGLMRPKDAEKIAKATQREFSEGIAAHGTDALRFTFAALASTGRDIKFDMKRVEGYRKFCNKIWNAARYVHGHIAGLDLACTPRSDLVIDRWIEQRCNLLCRQVAEHFAEFRFDLLAQSLYEFIWNDYCDWYLELTKPVLHGPDGAQRQATLATLARVLERSLRLLHPLMPFLSEELWQGLRPILSLSGESIMLQAYPAYTVEAEDGAAEADIAWLQSIVGAVRNMRSELTIAPGKQVHLLLRQGQDEDRERSQRLAPWLSSLARLESLRWLEADETLPVTATQIVAQLEIHMPLAGLIDLKAEAQRLHKELQRLTQDLARVESKLSSQSFIERAPADVVQKERTHRDELALAQSRLSAQLAHLESTL